VKVVEHRHFRRITGFTFGRAASIRPTGSHGFFACAILKTETRSRRQGIQRPISARKISCENWHLAMSVL